MGTDDLDLLVDTANRAGVALDREMLANYAWLQRFRSGNR